MLPIVLIFLIVLFILGYINIPFLPIRDIELFNLLGKTISVYDLAVFLFILWIIDLLPWPFRGLAGVILVLWLLSFFGIIAISGFSHILLLGLIIGVIAYLFRGFIAK
jgi:hypothetical protein